MVVRFTEGCCYGVVGQYAYTAHLKELERRRPEGAERVLPAMVGWTHIQCPMVGMVWSQCLEDHPDKAYSSYLINGIGAGFRVGFQYGRKQCIRAESNMQSARQHPEVIDAYLAAEVRAGRVLGPLEPGDYPRVHVNRFGLVPKNHQPGKWRLIVDLSHPRGASVNDGVEPELCTMSYTSVDVAVRRVLALGAGTRLAKFDVEGAYRTVPVHPDDRWLLGMRWRDKLYVDKVLPFGLRSAPKIYNAVADALLWTLRREGVDAIHYLDDFLLAGAPDSDQCGLGLRSSLEWCRQLGVPIAAHKTEGPVTSLVFLGIEIDTVLLTLRLPEIKLTRLQGEIRRWVGRRSCSKRELLSLIGQLQHACCVVKPGRSFLRRMIDLARVAKELHHSIRLNQGFRSDLCWWSCFLPWWNGVSMMSGVVVSSPKVMMTSDASGSWGCGAFTSAGEWFQLEFPESWNDIHITVKELLPIVIGAAVWGCQWKGLTVTCRCDNAAVVAIVNSGKSKVDRLMHLMRSLFFIIAKWNVVLECRHIPGVDNGAADALSRDNLPSFQRLVPEARREPAMIPEPLLRALVWEQPDWTAVSWTTLFTGSS